MPGELAKVRKPSVEYHIGSRGGLVMFDALGAVNVPGTGEKAKGGRWMATVGEQPSNSHSMHQMVLMGT
jgi:hypothetical protein